MTRLVGIQHFHPVRPGTIGLGRLRLDSTDIANASSGVVIPESLALLRARAAEEFEASELPDDTVESWRYTDLSAVDLASLSLGGSRSAPEELEVGALASDVEVLNAVSSELAAGVRISDGQVSAFAPHPDAICGPISGHVEAFAETAWTVAETGRDIFTAMAGAASPSGVYVRIPTDVDAGTVSVLVSAESGRTAAVPMIHVVLEKGATATLVLACEGAPDDVYLSAPVIEILLGPGSNLRVVIVQDYGPLVDEFQTIAARLDRDAHLSLSSVALGGRTSRVAIDCALAGEGSSSELLGAYFGTKGQHIDFRIVEDHQAPHTSGEILYKGAVKEAGAVFGGLIRVEEGAQKSSGYQTNRNLILGEGAWAESLPNLEILANDVSCSHASATGPIDEDQLYYLATRGIAPEKAERLIVMGFFEQVIARIPAPPLRGILSKRIEAKFNG